MQCFNIFFPEQVSILVFYTPGLLHHPIDRQLKVKLQTDRKTIESNQMTGTSVYTNTDNAAGFIYYAYHRSDYCRSISTFHKSLQGNVNRKSIAGGRHLFSPASLCTVYFHFKYWFLYRY